MNLDIFEGSSSGKWIGLFSWQEPEPPKKGEVVNTHFGRWRVKECTQQKHNRRPVNSYRVIAERV